MSSSQRVFEVRVWESCNSRKGCSVRGQARRMGSFTPYVSRRRTCVRAGIVLGNSGGVVSARLGREPQQPSPHLWLAWIAGFEVPRKKRGFRWVWADGQRTR